MKAPDKYVQYLKFSRIAEDVKKGAECFNIAVYTYKFSRRRQIGELWCTGDEIENVTSMLKSDGYGYTKFQMA